MFTFDNKSKHLFKNMVATILLGGNMGNRQAYLQFACFHLKKDLGKITAKSAIYETEAWGEVSTKNYLNQIVQIDVDVTPKNLLETVLNIELKAGRKRLNKWGNRTLDIDILFMEDLIIKEENLIIPHPEIQHRNFVLKPLSEINPGFIHPILGKSVQALLDACSDNLKVIKYQSKRV